jgi:hypothetical protein
VKVWATFLAQLITIAQRFLTLYFFSKMQQQTMTVGLYTAYQNATNKSFVSSKPEFSMAKTKEKLAEFFNQNEAVRQLCDENKVEYPRMHQSVQGTAWQLLMYYMKNWGKSVAKNYEIRICYSYLKKSLNDSCCVATLKNHINKLLKMYKAFIKAKHRGGLGLDHQNTACIVLEIDPQVLQFANERHNEAIRQGELSIEESRHRQDMIVASQKAAARSIINARADIDAVAQKRMETPSSISAIFSAAFGGVLQKE